MVWDPAVTSFDGLLKLFWEAHDPTQGMRQGNDVGTQYRSAICVSDEDQMDAAKRSLDAYNGALASSRATRRSPLSWPTCPRAASTTPSTYHQQYLSKNPNGYCGLGGTGVSLSDCRGEVAGE